MEERFLALHKFEELVTFVLVVFLDRFEGKIMSKVKIKVGNDDRFLKKLTLTIRNSLQDVYKVADIEVNKSEWENKEEKEYLLFICTDTNIKGYFPITERDLQAALNKECVLELYDRTVGQYIKGLRAKSLGESFLQLL